MRRAGLTVKEVVKDVKPGIQVVKKLLRENRLYFINCPYLEFEINQYRYRDQGNSKIDLNAPEEPIKENDHALDAIRYGLTMLEQRATHNHVAEQIVRLKTRHLMPNNKRTKPRAGLR